MVVSGRSGGGGGGGRSISYPLYGSPPPFPMKGYLCPYLDQAMEAFLTCVAQVAEHAAVVKHPNSNSNPRRMDNRDGDEHRGGEDEGAGVSPGLTLPYPIVGDRVGGLTVKLSLNKEATWTAAMKMMLADMAVLVGHATADGCGPE